MVVMIFFCWFSPNQEEGGKKAAGGATTSSGRRSPPRPPPIRRNHLRLLATAGGDDGSVAAPAVAYGGAAALRTSSDRRPAARLTMRARPRSQGATSEPPPAASISHAPLSESSSCSSVLGSKPCATCSASPGAAGSVAAHKVENPSGESSSSPATSALESAYRKARLRRRVAGVLAASSIDRWAEEEGIEEEATDGAAFQKEQKAEAREPRIQSRKANNALHTLLARAATLSRCGALSPPRLRRCWTESC